MTTWKNRYADVEKPVGAGYYAARTTISKGGVVYTKLVKRDREPTGRLK